MKLPPIFLLVFLAIDMFLEALETSILSVSEGDLLTEYSEEKITNIIKLKEEQKCLLVIVLILETIVQYFFNIFLLHFCEMITNSVFLQTSVAVFISLLHIFFTMLIKNITLANVTKVAFYTSKPFYYVFLFFQPLGKFFEGINSRIIDFFSLSEEKQTVSSYKKKILSALRNKEKVLRSDREAQIIRSALSIQETQIVNIMTPRVDFISLEFTNNLEEMKNRLLKIACTKVIIWEEEEDNILGILDVKDFFMSLSIRNISNIMYKIHPIIRFPSTTNVYTLLEFFNTTFHKIIFVTNEYDSVIGLVTLTDVLDEIVGNVEQEFLLEVKDNEVTVDGMYKIRHLNRKMNWTLPEKYLTVSGLIITLARKIPIKDSIYQLFDYIIIVQEVERNIISRAVIKKSHQLLT